MELAIKKSSLWVIIIIIILALAVIFFVWKPFSGNQGTRNVMVEGSTFFNTGDNIVTDSEGKPYVILFSTTWCPHCQWIADTFDSLAEEPFSSQINLQHWELDTGDNTLTPEIETQVPQEMLDIYEKYNSRGSIPTFVFGGKYMRIGTGYEGQNDLQAELEDFRLIIGKLL